jgi:hypothetical protein
MTVDAGKSNGNLGIRNSGNLITVLLSSSSYFFLVSQSVEFSSAHRLPAHSLQTQMSTQKPLTVISDDILDESCSLFPPIIRLADGDWPLSLKDRHQHLSPLQRVQVYTHDCAYVMGNDRESTPPQPLMNLLGKRRSQQRQVQHDIACT